MAYFLVRDFEVLKEHTLYLGCVVHSRSSTELEIFEKGAFLVDARGKIAAIGNASDVLVANPAAKTVNFGQSILIPGFVDTHVHLPQYVFAGLGARELLEWLQTYTFPMETRFSDSAFARKASQIFFADLAKVGTTCAAVYATSHREATDIAFEEAEKCGVRAFIGMVLMERNGATELHREWRSVIHDCEYLAEKWNANNNKLHFAITPRFAITCGENMLKGAAEVARKRDLLVQTHLSENRSEIDFTLSLFPGAKDYTEIYERAGLLTSKTLLAHGIHLSKGEKQRIRAAGSTIVHCATSNRYLQSGVFGFRETAQDGVAISLGSDIAGGYDLSMLHEIREAIETSKTRNILNRETTDSRCASSDIHETSYACEVISVSEAFYAATLGGAVALGMDNAIGNFAVGKQADFVVLVDGHVNRFADSGFYQTGLERLTRLIYRGNAQAVHATFVQGERIF